MPIQRGLFTQYVPKKSTHQELQQNVQQLLSTQKATRTTQPTEGKRESDE